jgi:hypothetical protein
MSATQTSESAMILITRGGCTVKSRYANGLFVVVVMDPGLEYECLGEASEYAQAVFNAFKLWADLTRLQQLRREKASNWGRI